MLHPEGMRLPRVSPSSQVLDPGTSRRDVGAASPPQILQTSNLCPLLAFFRSFSRRHRHQRQPNTDIKWLPGSLAFPGCLLSPGAAKHRPPGLILPRRGAEPWGVRGRSLGGRDDPAVLCLPVPSQATPCPALSPAVDIPAGSSRALAAPPGPEHPDIPEPRGPAHGSPGPARPRRRQGRGDKGTARSRSPRHCPGDICPLLPGGDRGLCAEPGSGAGTRLAALAQPQISPRPGSGQQVTPGDTPLPRLCATGLLRHFGSLCGTTA